MDVPKIAGNAVETYILISILPVLSIVSNFVKHSCHVIVSWLLKNLRIIVVRSDIRQTRVAFFCLTNFVQYVVKNVLELIQTEHAADLHS